MQFTTILAILAAAMTTAATPASKTPNVAVRTGNAPYCSTTTGKQPICCNGILNCVVTVGGAFCGGSSCCYSTTEAPGTELIDIDLNIGCLL